MNQSLHLSTSPPPNSTLSFQEKKNKVPPLTQREIQKIIDEFTPNKEKIINMWDKGWTPYDIIKGPKPNDTIH